VAFAIFALAAAAVFEVFAGASRRAVNASDRERALLIAQSLLSQLRVQPLPWPQNKEGRAASGESWRIRVEPFDSGTDAASPWRAFTVDVSVATEAPPRQVTLRSLELGRSQP
jgi:type II secretory pathway pseudopilin PulG